MGATKYRYLASSVVALILSACAGQTPSVPTPSASPSVPISPAPSASTTAVPSILPTASSVPMAMTIMHGTVYDDAANFAPDGTTVVAHSLDPAHPFDQTASVAGGTFSFPAVPIGVQIQYTASHPSWTTRSRVAVAVQNSTNSPNRNLLNFGGTPNAIDQAGPAYFLSDHPEIESVTPVDQATEQPNDQMAFKLALSEPLDDANRRRLGAAFTIIPNNAAALGDSQALPAPYATSGDLLNLYSGANPPATAAYSYRENSGFSNGFALSSFNWASDNQTATFTLQAPVKTSVNDEGQYAFLLVQQDTNAIQDPEGLQLGMNSQSKWTKPNLGELIRYAIKQTEVSLPDSAQVASNPADLPAQRWTATHQTFTTFSIARDTVAPRLVSVLARRNYTSGSGTASDRIELTFSEPMVAYPDIAGDQVLSLNNYIITAAPTLDELSSRALGSSAPARITGGESSSTIQNAITSGVGMLMDNDGSQMNGVSQPFTIAPSVTDPRVVVITMPANSLPLDASYLKVYAGSDTYASSSANKSISDPAGNPIASGGTTQTGAIQ